jgi:hypothetical protein
MILIAAGVAGLALATPAGAMAKQGSGRVNLTQQVSQGVPDRATGSAPFGVLTSTITVGKKFKGKRVRDVNVTLQTLGSSATSAADLFAILTAPNGATVTLFNGLAGQSIGPLTLDDESRLHLGSASCVDPTGLCAPYTGAAEPTGELASMDNGRVKGTWTLKVVDLATSNTSILSFWGLNVAAGNPYRTG